MDATEALARLLGTLPELPALLAAIERRLGQVEQQLAEVRVALPPALLSLPEAAKHLGVSVSTLKRQARAGQLPVRHVGRRVLVDVGALRPASDEKVARVAGQVRSLMERR